MAIQQNVNQILSLSAVFARMSPLGEMAEYAKNVKSAKQAYEQQSEAVESIKKNRHINQIEPRKSQLDAAKNLYKLEPTRELAHNINAMERDINMREEIIAKNASIRQEMAAKKAAADAMNAEKARQKADRARETRLKILEGIPLSKESEGYTKKLLESNTPSGQPLKEQISKMEEKE